MENHNDEMNGAEQETFAPEYRDRLRTWLIKMINSGKIPGLFWENEEKTIFRMPWKHAGRQDYNLEEDSKIFMAWAKHSGRYRQGIDKPEPIVWKTRLRCALNKMPDIRELPDRSRLDISEPYRVYHLLPPVHKASQIRRRLYKRSQSQDTDHVKAYVDQSQNVSRLNSSEHEAEAWRENGVGPRRSTSMETAKSNLSPSASPPISTAPSGYWFAPSVNIPLKTAAALPTSLHLPHTTPIPVEAMNPLWKQLAQARYPLVPPLHAPFVPFSTTSMAPMFPNTQASLAALKQLGLSPPSAIDQAKQLNDQAMTTEQNYREHLTTLTRKLDEESKNFSDEKILCHRLANMEKISAQHFAPIRRNSSDLKAIEADANMRNVQVLLGSNASKYLSKLNPLSLQLYEFQKRIETLEKDLDESRTAHARERDARKKMEMECEKIKILLQHTDKGIARPEEFTQSQEKGFWKNFNGLHSEKPFAYDTSRMVDGNSTPQTRQAAEKEVNPRDLLRVPSSDHFTAASAFVAMRKSSVQIPTKPVVKEEKGSETFQKKRSSLPLDLSVYSPPKLQRLSGDEDTDVTTYSSTSSSYCASSTFVTSSSPGLTSCDDKRVILSPLSASGDSSGSSSPHISSDYQRGSVSPPRRANGLLQAHQGTIKVT